jgi:hypothetical protein
LNAQRRHAASFIQHPAPQLIIEKMYFPGDANSYAGTGFGNRQGTRCQVWGIRDLFCDPQNPLSGGFTDTRPPMQGTIDRPNRNMRKFRDQMDSTFIFLHSLVLPAIATF